MQPCICKLLIVGERLSPPLDHPAGGRDAGAVVANAGEPRPGALVDQRRLDGSLAGLLVLHESRALVIETSGPDAHRPIVRPLDLEEQRARVRLAVDLNEHVADGQRTPIYVVCGPEHALDRTRKAVFMVVAVDCDECTLLRCGALLGCHGGAQWSR